MTGEKAIMSVVPVAMSANLLGSMARRKKKKKLVGTAVDAITGTSLIQAESQLIGLM